MTTDKKNPGKIDQKTQKEKGDHDNSAMKDKKVEENRHDKPAEYERPEKTKSPGPDSQKRSPTS